MYNERRCWLCGQNNFADPLEKHHIFGAANRKKCDKLGLTVYLCGSECHRNGKFAAHVNPDTRLRLRQYGQRKAMEENGWTVQDFIREFGKNYLDEVEENEKDDEMQK